jgi:hypothetical protein
MLSVGGLLYAASLAPIATVFALTGLGIGFSRGSSNCRRQAHFNRLWWG